MNTATKTKKVERQIDKIKARVEKIKAKAQKRRGRPPLPDNQRRTKVWTSLDAATLAALEALYPGVPVHEQLRRYVGGARAWANRFERWREAGAVTGDDGAASADAFAAER